MVGARVMVSDSTVPKHHSCRARETQVNTSVSFPAEETSSLGGVVVQGGARESQDQIQQPGLCDGSAKLCPEES